MSRNLSLREQLAPLAAAMERQRQVDAAWAVNQGLISKVAKKSTR